ncbi:hypothetical protein, partial [Endothiovibrio diazotrophicus]
AAGEDAAATATLAIPAGDGGPWLALGTRIHRFDADGVALGVIRTNSAVRSLTVADNPPWVIAATADGVLAYDGDGHPLGAVPY